MQIVDEKEKETSLRANTGGSKRRGLYQGQRKAGSSRYGHLLSDEDMRLWYRQLERGSEDTAENYLKRLGRFCDEHDVTPKGYLSLPKKTREDLLIKYIDLLS